MLFHRVSSRRGKIFHPPFVTHLRPTRPRGAASLSALGSTGRRQSMKRRRGDGSRMDREGIEDRGSNLPPPLNKRPGNPVKLKKQFRKQFEQRRRPPPFRPREKNNLRNHDDAVLIFLKVKKRKREEITICLSFLIAFLRKIVC